MVMRALGGFALGRNLFSSIPRPISNVSNTISFYSHHSFDGITEPTILSFRTLNRLKLNSFEPDHVSSAHCLSLKTNTLSDLSARTSLLTAYAGAQDLDSALSLFDETVTRDVILWNAIISAFVHNFHFRSSILLFQEMVEKFGGFDSTTLLIVMPALSHTRNLKYATTLHGTIIKKSFCIDVNLCNALIDMYAKCDDISSSELVFKEMAVKDVASWNCMINGCTHNELPERSLYYFRKMRCLNVKADSVSLLSGITTCSLLEELSGVGESVHGVAIKMGYQPCRFHMHSFLPVKPDSITFVSALSACGHLTLLFYGQSLHGLALKSLVDSDVSVKNALLTMYFRCNDSNSAEALFKLDGERNVYTWNCMVSGFVQNIEGGKSLKLFRNMEVEPNEFTIVSVLCACTQLGDLRQGKVVHGYVFRIFLEENTFILSALVDMYNKCGRLDIASLVFESSKEKSVASWNSMISAYGRHGEGRKSIELFTSMCKSGVKTTKSTFVALLSACRHCGLVNEGLKYFNDMSQEHGIEPNVEHCVHVIDMLGRTGRLTDAQELIEKLPFKEEPGVWGALLSACRDHGNLSIGKTAAQKLFCSEPENIGYYVTLSNLFANCEMWNEAVKTRGLILERGLQKPPGCSVVDVLSG